MQTATTSIPRSDWMIHRDLQAVLKIERASAVAYQRRAWSEGDFLRRLRQRYFVGIVVRDDARDGRVIGYAIYRLRRRSIEVLRLVSVRAGMGVEVELVRRLFNRLDGDTRRKSAVLWAGRVRVKFDHRPELRAAWQTDTVRALLAIPAVPLPILADALQDADCDDTALLTLFRAGGAAADAVCESLNPFTP
jgi:hypothetical protein